MRTVNPEQHARRRAAILAASAEEFAANGIDGTSTADICRRAGIGSGTLFHYFPTKRDIWHALFADDLETNARACEEALAEPDPRAGLDLLLNHLLRDLGSPLVPGLLAGALLQVNRDPEFAALLAADEDQVREALVTLVTRLDAPGRTLPASSTARWIQHLIDAVFFSAAAEDFDAQQQAAELRRVVALLLGSPGRVRTP